MLYSEVFFLKDTNFQLPLKRKTLVFPEKPLVCKLISFVLISPQILLSDQTEDKMAEKKNVSLQSGMVCLSILLQVAIRFLFGGKLTRFSERFLTLFPPSPVVQLQSGRHHSNPPISCNWGPKPL